MQNSSLQVKNYDIEVKNLLTGSRLPTQKNSPHLLDLTNMINNLVRSVYLFVYSLTLQSKKTKGNEEIDLLQS